MSREKSGPADDENSATRLGSTQGTQNRVVSSIELQPADATSFLSSLNGSIEWKTR